jgi:hypothetical protein
MVFVFDEEHEGGGALGATMRGIGRPEIQNEGFGGPRSGNGLVDVKKTHFFSKSYWSCSQGLPVNNFRKKCRKRPEFTGTREEETSYSPQQLVVGGPMLPMNGVSRLHCGIGYATLPTNLA